MSTPHDPHAVTDGAALRAMYGETSERVAQKKGSRLTPTVVAALELAPFFCLSTSDSAGRCDASPRGGPSGFLRVIDEQTLAFPDLSGNRLIDSLSNLVENPAVGMLIITPGRDETIRINGTARLTLAPEVLALWDGVLRGVKLAVVVTVDDVYVHCAKAFRRSRLWQPDTWADYDSTPDMTDVFNDIVGATGGTAEMRTMLETDYEQTLSAERPD